MTRPDNRAAWADFWAAGGSAQGSGCLPQALVGINNAQSAVWQDLARALPANARVLDLGAGDGAVFRKMLDVRKDLRLTGVDSSATLPQAGDGFELQAGVAIEALPFADAFFEAVTSQFGYEYGDTAAAAPEVARVLKPNGIVVFVVHLAGSPIVAHNLPRREALRWALDESGYLAKARALVAARRMAPLPTPPSFRSAPDEARRLFSGQSVAAEFLQAVLQTLELGKTSPPAESIEVLRELESKARNEIARIDSLERAACDEARIEAIAGELRDAGLDVGEPRPLIDYTAGRPFAWLLTGVPSGRGTSR